MPTSHISLTVGKKLRSKEKNDRKDAELLARFNVTRDSTRSIILIEDGQIFLRSTASLRIASRLTFPWRLAAAFLWIPVPIRDAAYRLVAAIRYRIAGRSNACEIPPPEIRARLI